MDSAGYGKNHLEFQEVIPNGSGFPSRITGGIEFLFQTCDLFILASQQIVHV